MKNWADEETVLVLGFSELARERPCQAASHPIAAKNNLSGPHLQVPVLGFDVLQLFVHFESEHCNVVPEHKTRAQKRVEASSDAPGVCTTAEEASRPRWILLWSCFLTFVDVDRPIWTCRHPLACFRVGWRVSLTVK